MSWKRLWLATAGIVVGIAAIFGGNVLWRAGAALGEMRVRVDAEASLRVRTRPLVPVLPAGLQTIGAPSSFTDAAEFQGHLFIAGPAGLTEYDANGALAARYRVGAELPPAPLTALAQFLQGDLAGDSRAPELWIATAGEGVVGFDGRGFRQIRPEDAKLRKITALLPLSTGRILLGTEKSGVLVWDGHELKSFHATLAGVPVTALAGDDASLWIGTLDRGLLHWRAGSVETVAGLPDPRVLSLALPAVTDDRIFVGTAMGVSEIQDGKVARTLAQGYFAQSVLAANGKLWVGTLEEGMFEVPLEAGPAARVSSARPGRALGCTDCSIRKIFSVGAEIYALAEDSLWHGAQAVLGREAVTSGESTILKDRNISALAMDSSGRLWIGFFDRGLQILAAGGGRGEEFEDDHLFCVNRIVHDASRGVSAVATANGLVLFDTSSTRQRLIGAADGLIANQVTDVAMRADGSIVAATPAGLSFIDASGISSIYAFQGLVNNHVYALASDGARTLAGTLGGLSVLDGEVVKASYTTANSALKHNWITSIVRVNQDLRANQEWFVGTYGAGVLRLDALGRWEPFEDLRGTLEINTNAMAVSPVAVYAGTLDRGLAVFNRSSGRWNFFLSGLPSANVTAVEVRGGMVYIGTDNGLVKVPETTLVIGVVN
jgi:ligand-binding sensor domain-containing protein